MRTAWLIGAACLLMVVGCKSEQDVVREVQVLVGLQRTPCFGRCPVYEFSVLSTGEATLKVERFCTEAFGRALEEGMHTAKVDVQAWDEVLAMADTFRFDTLANRYDNPQVTDLPASIITVRGKTVFNRYGGPDLNELYERIERTIGQTDWTADPAIAR